MAPAASNTGATVASSVNSDPSLRRLTNQPAQARPEVIVRQSR
jgi:hypothetical protein